MPDFLNTDASDLRQSGTWHTGFGNSTNDKYRRSLRLILDDIVTQNPAGAFVAGDLVEGHRAEAERRSERVRPASNL
jgi:hypothetical protein